MQTTIALTSMSSIFLLDASQDERPASLPPATHPEGLPERYVAINLLGDGGMAQVWRVFDQTLGREVALKVMHHRRAMCAKQAARFIEEAQVTAQLDHPGVVTLYDLGQLPDGRYYFSMDVVGGETLSDLIRTLHAASPDGEWRTAPDVLGGPGWNLRWLVDVFLQICEVVSYAHSRGVLHRDLKPQNIMVGTYGEARLLDWGLARVANRPELPSETIQTERSASGAHATRHGAVIGTPAYMSPEQARGETLTPSSDVYSLGCVLYEVLAGCAPFNLADITTMLSAVKNGEASPLPDRLPLPKGLVAICEKAMAIEPADRYADAEELAVAVANWLLHSASPETMTCHHSM